MLGSLVSCKERCRTRTQVHQQGKVTDRTWPWGQVYHSIPGSALCYSFHEVKLFSFSELWFFPWKIRMRMLVSQIWERMLFDILSARIWQTHNTFGFPSQAHERCFVTCWASWRIWVGRSWAHTYKAWPPYLTVPCCSTIM